MEAKGDGAVTRRRGPGRPPREPDLVPPNRYDEYREPFMRQCEAWFHAWENEQARDELAREIRAEYDATVARLTVLVADVASIGGAVDIPPPPPEPDGFFANLRQLGAMPREHQLQILGAEKTMQVIARWTTFESLFLRRPIEGGEAAMPLPQRTADPVEGAMLWLVTHAASRGLVTPGMGPYQVWIVFAKMMLRTQDIGRVLRTVRAHVMERSNHATEKTQDEQDLDRARQQIKRVDALIAAFRDDD